MKREKKKKTKVGKGAKQRNYFFSGKKKKKRAKTLFLCESFFHLGLLTSLEICNSISHNLGPSADKTNTEISLQKCMQCYAKFSALKQLVYWQELLSKYEHFLRAISTVTVQSCKICCIILKVKRGGNAINCIKQTQ